MKEITILDGYTINPNEDELKLFKEFGNVSIYYDTKPDNVLERVKNSNYVFTDYSPIDSKTIMNCSNLEYIGIMATGMDSVDIKTAEEKNIAFANVTNYSTRSVAQHTVALLLQITNNIEFFNAYVKDKKWKKDSDAFYWDVPKIELYNKTACIIGYGNIGKAVEEILLGFGMNVVIVSDHFGPKAIKLAEVLGLADVVTIHKPLSESNKKLINKDFISKMKDNAILINCSRGGLIDEGDLYEALKSKKLMAAGLDVMSIEPPENDNPLLTLDNCILTPHVGFASEESRKELIKQTISNLKQYVNGVL